MKPTTIKDAAGDNTFAATSAAEVFVFNTRYPGLNVINDFEWGVDQVQFIGGQPKGFGFVETRSPKSFKSIGWDGGSLAVNYLTPVPASEWHSVF